MNNFQLPGQSQPRPEGQRPRTVGQATNDVNVDVDADVDGRSDVESRQQFLQVWIKHIGFFELQSSTCD